MDTIHDLIADIRQGKMIILMDDEGRENEGDLIMAAQHATPEAINFMVTHGRGLVCMPMFEAHRARLGLPLMVSTNRCRFGTNFTVSIEAAHGVTTGISAFERAHTLRVASDPNAGPADVISPGHIFPLCARSGGVLERAGHTEATCDLVALAGLYPVGVLCEILDVSGKMARRPELEVFAKKHQLKIGTVADLIRYRQAHTAAVTV